MGDSQGRLLSVSWDSLSKVNWQVHHHSDWVNSICKTHQFIITGSSDQTIVSMNSTTRQKVHTFQANSFVYQLLLTPGDKNLLVLCSDKYLLLKNVNGDMQLISEKPYQEFKNEYLRSFTLLSHSNTVVVGDNNGHLCSMRLIE